MVQWFNVIPLSLAATTTTTATVPITPPTTSDSTAPSPPILIAPADETTTENSSPTYIWNQSTDPNSNTVLYTLYLNGKATYLNISGTGNSGSPAYTTILEGDTIRLTPTYALPDATYSWYITARDLSGNISRSATWSFSIDTSIPPFAASISKVDTRSYLPYTLYGLLAFIVLILLIILWRRRYNIILLNGQGLPLTHTKVYHSLPPQSSSIYSLTSINHGRLYIPHLGRYSTLTVITDSTTYLLSLSVKSRQYIVKLG